MVFFQLQSSSANPQGICKSSNEKKWKTTKVNNDNNKSKYCRNKSDKLTRPPEAGKKCSAGKRKAKEGNLASMQTFALRLMMAPCRWILCIFDEGDNMLENCLAMVMNVCLYVLYRAERILVLSRRNQRRQECTRVLALSTAWFEARLMA
jgi:hypothetical protein